MTQQAALEVTITPVFIAADICRNCLDVVAFTEYLKSANRKEIIFVNPLDCIELTKLPPKTPDCEVSVLIARAIRAKIDQEMTRALDAKRRFTIILEKQRQVIASAVARGKHPRIADPIEPDEPKFDGRLDLLFILLDFPFLPAQINALDESGVPLAAFVSFIPGVIPVNHYGHPLPPPPPEDPKKAKRRLRAITIPGVRLSSHTNPDCYPPPRWDGLRPRLPPSVPFREVIVGADHGESFAALEKEIIKILRAKDRFPQFMASKRIIDLPVCHLDNDISLFARYVRRRPTDYVNAIWAQLSASDLQTRPPPPAKETADVYNDIFNAFSHDAQRSTVYEREEPHEEPHFVSAVLPRVSGLFQKLLAFRPNEEEARVIDATCRFASSPQHLYAYAGQRFDQLYVQLNKKYQLGLPNAFFDWQYWGLAKEDANAPKVVAEALEGAAVLDSLFDESIGVLWLMTMRPIPKVTGHFLTRRTFPQTIDGISEWMTYLADSMHDAVDKKSKPPGNPALVVRNGGDALTMLMPLAARVEPCVKLYRLPLKLSDSREFKTPYFFESGIHVEIDRNIYEGTMDFGYTIFLQKLLRIQTAGDSLVLAGDSNVRFDRAALTVFASDKSLCYDGDQLVLKSSGADSIIVTNAGDLIRLHSGAIPMIVRADGTVSQFIDEKWENVDESGVTRINGEVVDRPHSVAVHPRTKTSVIIRPDRMNYRILHSGARLIGFPGEFDVEQPSQHIKMKLPDYPEIRVIDKSIRFKLGESEFVLTKQKMTQQTKFFTATFAEGVCSLETGRSQLLLSPTSLEIKEGDLVLISNSQGVESLGTIYVQTNAKKKVETIETAFGKIVTNKEVNAEPVLLNLHKLFPPRFFGIRSNMSVVEFLRHDILPEMVEKRTTVSHPSQEAVVVLTRHLPDASPEIYIENEALTKPARSALLKSLHVPKAARAGKGKIDTETIRPATEAIAEYLTTSEKFAEKMGETMQTNQLSYLEAIKPIPPPPPEIIRIPPQLPPPRSQRMQCDKIQGGVIPGRTNYWLCHESDFGYPLDEPKRLPRIVSSRRFLHDPPRWFRKARDTFPDAPNTGGRFMLTQPTVPIRVRDSPSPRGIPISVTTAPDEVNFGEIAGDTEVITGLVLGNSGTRPLHFSFSRLDTKFVTIVTLPGVVYPGLKVPIQVKIQRCQPQKIRTAFKIITPQFDIAVPVMANVVGGFTEEAGSVGQTAEPASA
jgi:hypothetical protein